jgi:hypothetical protein
MEILELSFCQRIPLHTKFEPPELLSRGVNTELEIMEFLKMLKLNDIAYSADLACVRKATPTNIANCWK